LTSRHSEAQPLLAKYKELFEEKVQRRFARMFAGLIGKDYYEIN